MARNLVIKDGMQNICENNHKQNDLIGWHDASRDIAGNVRPLITIY